MKKLLASIKTKDKSRPNPQQKTADQLAAELNEELKREGRYLEEREGEENELQVVFLPKKKQQKQEEKNTKDSQEVEGEAVFLSTYQSLPGDDLDTLIAEGNEQARKEGRYQESSLKPGELQVVFLPKKPNSSGQKLNPENSSKESKGKKKMALDELRQRVSLEFKTKSFWGKVGDVVGTAFDFFFRAFIYTIIAVVVLTLIILFFQYGF